VNAAPVVPCIGRAFLKVLLEFLPSISTFPRLSGAGQLFLNLSKWTFFAPCCDSHPTTRPNCPLRVQIKKFISCVEFSSLKTVFLACLYTGRRVEGPLGSSWEVVDLGRMEFTVRVTKARTGRTLPISNSFLDILHRSPRVGTVVFSRRLGGLDAISLQAERRPPHVAANRGRHTNGLFSSIIRFF